MQFIIESGFKSRASYNGVRMVDVVETLDTVHGGFGKDPLLHYIKLIETEEGKIDFQALKSAKHSHLQDIVRNCHFDATILKYVPRHNKKICI